MKITYSYLVCFLITVSAAHAQMKYKGFGVFGSLTHSAHKYVNDDTDKKLTDSAYKVFYPQTHISKEYFNWGVGVFLELGGNTVRWQTEAEYVSKGANEMALVNPYTGARTGSYESNKFTYIQWNNYLKFYYPLGGAHWYYMLGIRLEYLFSSSAGTFPPVSGDFPTFWFSGDVGLGYEFPIVKKISAFAEYHWNPDIISHTHDNTSVRNRTMELRIGIVIRPKKRSIDDCNAPVYRGPAY